MRQLLMRFATCLLVVGTSLGACSMAGSGFTPSPMSRHTGEANTDPKVGWVEMFPGDTKFKFYKRCSGTLLVIAREDPSSGAALVDSAFQCM